MIKFLKSKTFIALLLGVITITVGLLGWGYATDFKYFTSENTNQTEESQTNESSDESADDSTDANTQDDQIVETQWIQYNNTERGYTFEYPANWYVETDRVSPPAPAIVLVVNISDEEFAAGETYIRFQVDAFEPASEPLESFSEITYLQNDGFTMTNTTIAGQPALLLKRNTTDNDNGGYAYFNYNGLHYRITWGGSDVDLSKNSEDIYNHILDSFEFYQ